MLNQQSKVDLILVLIKTWQINFSYKTKKMVINLNSRYFILIIIYGEPCKSFIGVKKKKGLRVFFFIIIITDRLNWSFIFQRVKFFGSKKFTSQLCNSVFQKKAYRCVRHLNAFWIRISE